MRGKDTLHKSISRAYFALLTESVFFELSAFVTQLFAVLLEL